MCLFYYIDLKYPEIEDNVTDRDFLPQVSADEEEEEENIGKKKKPKIISLKSNLIQIFDIIKIAIENCFEFQDFKF